MFRVVSNYINFLHELCGVSELGYQEVVPVVERNINVE